MKHRLKVSLHSAHSISYCTGRVRVKREPKGVVLSDDEGAVMSSEREEEEERRKQEMIDFTKISFESLKAVSKGFNEHIKDFETRASLKTAVV